MSCLFFTTGFVLRTEFRDEVADSRFDPLALPRQLLNTRLLFTAANKLTDRESFATNHFSPNSPTRVSLMTVTGAAIHLSRPSP